MRASRQLLRAAGLDGRRTVDDSFAFTIGPRLGVNLGYAPTRLIRLGIGSAVAFSTSVAKTDGTLSALVDGWGRWTIGPSVGFRFGPKVPIELDLAVNFANFANFGSQASGASFDALAKQYGMTNDAVPPLAARRRRRHLRSPRWPGRNLGPGAVDGPEWQHQQQRRIHSVAPAGREFRAVSGRARQF